MQVYAPCLKADQQLLRVAELLLVRNMSGSIYCMYGLLCNGDTCLQVGLLITLVLPV